MNGKTIDQYPLVLDAKHIAEIMGCSYVTACRFMDVPDFPGIKMGRLRRVSRDRFFEWLNQFQKGGNK